MRTIRPLPGEVDVVEVGAAGWGSVEAGPALPAVQEAQGDVVSGLDLRDGTADRFHHAGSLVSEHDRQRHRVHLVPDHEVGVAQAGCDDTHDNLVRTWRLHEHGIELERAFGPDDGGCDLSGRQVGHCHASSAVLEDRPRHHLGVRQDGLVVAVELAVFGTKSIGDVSRDRTAPVGEETGVRGR